MESAGHGGVDKLESDATERASRTEAGNGQTLPQYSRLVAHPVGVGAPAVIGHEGLCHRKCPLRRGSEELVGINEWSKFPP